MGQDPNKVCENCGAVYEVSTISLPARDRDTASCDDCGALLESWNGAMAMYFKKIKGGHPLKVRRTQDEPDSK
jgi:hypothetical protein